MKVKFRRAAIAGVAIVALMSCATSGSGTSASPAAMIERTAGIMAADLPNGTRVAVVAFESERESR